MASAVFMGLLKKFLKIFASKTKKAPAKSQVISQGLQDGFIRFYLSQAGTNPNSRWNRIKKWALIYHKNRLKVVPAVVPEVVP